MQGLHSYIKGFPKVPFAVRAAVQCARSDVRLGNFDTGPISQRGSIWAFLNSVRDGATFASRALTAVKRATLRKEKDIRNWKYKLEDSPCPSKKCRVHQRRCAATPSDRSYHQLSPDWAIDDNHMGCALRSQGMRHDSVTFVIPTFFFSFFTRISFHSKWNWPVILSLRLSSTGARTAIVTLWRPCTSCHIFKHYVMVLQIPYI